MLEGKGFKIFLAIFSAFVSVVLGVVITKFANDLFFKDQLVYEIINSEPFTSNNETIQITRFSVENDGSKLMENIDITIDPKNRTIDQHKIYGPGFNPDQVKVTQDASLFHAHIDYLNPNEKLFIQFLFRASREINSDLSASVRSKGVVGELRSDKGQKNTDFLLVAPAALSTVAFALVLFLWRRRIIDVIPDTVSQRDVMFALYVKYSFQEFADRMLNSSKDNITYALESEALTRFCLAQKDGGIISKAIAVQEDLIRGTNMHPGSAQLVRFNIARLYMAIGNEVAAKSALKELRPRSDKLVQLKINEPELKRLLESS